jgi:hypothetical protein
MLDFKKMTKKSDFQYERDTIKIFMHFLQARGLCIAGVQETEKDNELFIAGNLDKLVEDFIHECVKR